MEISNCKSCGRLFSYIGGQKICVDCKDEIEKKFSEVKRYIQDHNQATMAQIAEDMDVSISQIRQWVREERLYFTQDSPLGIDCEICGKTIKTGRFCNECKANMTNELNGAYPKEPELEIKKETKDRARMRYLDL